MPFLLCVYITLKIGIQIVLIDSSLSVLLISLSLSIMCLFLLGKRMEQIEAGCSGGAEAVLSLQANVSISVAYHSQFGPHKDLILLELDEKLLPDFIHQR